MKKYININSKHCEIAFSEALRNCIQSTSKAYDEICVACIGTDRSTGDSLGPLVGYKLQDTGIQIRGTLDSPLHAQNLSDFKPADNTLVIAVDACLGKMDHVGYIKVEKGSLKPGSGINKDLPPIGDISIAGIVNFGGFMDYLVLQNTRLSLVMRMADVISDGLKQVVCQMEEYKCTA